MENARWQTNNWMHRKKQFLSKIWEQKEHNRNTKWINNMKKEWQGLEEGPEADIHMDLLRGILKKVQNWKIPGQPNGWQRGKLPWSRKTPKKETSPAIMCYQLCQILTHRLKKKSITCLNPVDYFQKNWKDTAREMTYYISMTCWKLAQKNIRIDTT